MPLRTGEERVDRLVGPGIVEAREGESMSAGLFGRGIDS
jgi:hypothetical protein